MNGRASLMERGAWLAVGWCVAAGFYASSFNMTTRVCLAWLVAALVMVVLLLLLLRGRAAGQRTGQRPKRLPPHDAPFPCEQGRKPLISLVLLLRRARYLDEVTLARLVRKAWGIALGPANEGTNFIAGTLPSFVVRVGHHSFLVNSFSVPYFRHSAQAARSIREPLLSKLVASHRAWLSVDLIGGSRVDAAEAYRWIGRLIAALADDNSLAIISPEVGRICAYTPELKATLNANDPLVLFGGRRRSGQQDRHKEKEDLLLAAEQARSLWPRFVEAFEDRNGEQYFAVKAPPAGGRDSTSLWLNVTAIENGIIYGRPAGDRERRRIVRAKIQDVQDWMYTEGSGMRGGFSIEASKRSGHRSSPTLPGEGRSDSKDSGPPDSGPL